MSRNGKGEVAAAAAQEWRNTPVLVTGGGGFIGSNLVDALVDAGASVRVLDNFSTGRRENLAASAAAIDLVEGSLTERSVCERACDEIEVVFHQAALGSIPRSLDDPATTFAVNVGGTANLFTAARDAGVSRVVYASSSSVYGDSAELPRREGREGRVLSPYALSKRMNEQQAEVFATCFGTELVGLRYFNVYGPRQSPDGPYAAVVPLFFAALAAGEAPWIHGDGRQSRDFTFVGDAVSANLLAARAPAAACGRAYNVGAGGRTTIGDLASAIRRLTGGPEPRFGPRRAGDVLHSHADLGAVEEAIGYHPAVSLEDGLARLWESLNGPDESG